MSKRSNGEGSLEQLPSGSWRGRISVMGEDGKLVTRRVTRSKPGEVLTELRRLRTEADKGRSIAQDTRVTVKAHFETWEEKVLPTQVRPATADLYRSLISTHALPVLGDKRMAAVKPSHIESLVHGLDRSQSTKRSLYAALRKLWGSAVRDGIVSRDVVSEVARPSLEGRKPESPSVAHVRALLAAAQGTRLEPLVLLLATTGARRGELLACRWSDVETRPDGSYLHIRGSLGRASDGLRIRPPKTISGTRRIPLPMLAVAALAKQRRQQAAEHLAAGSAWIDSGHIFTTEVGGAMEPRNASRAYAALAAKAKVPAPGMHALRHYCATVLLDGGSSAREVADQLGHSSPVVTLELYAATIPEHQRAAVDRAASLLA